MVTIFGNAGNSSGDFTLTMRATLAGTEIAGSQAGINVNNAHTPVTVGRSFIVSVTSGQALVVQLTGSSTASNIAPTGSGTATVSASITIERIN